MQWKPNDRAWILENNMKATMVTIVRPANGRYIIKLDNGGGTVVSEKRLFATEQEALASKIINRR